jgi:lipoprotein-releasing system permease protein
MLAACGSSSSPSSPSPASTPAQSPRTVLRDQVFAMNAHVTVMKRAGMITDHRDLVRTIEQQAGVVAAEAFRVSDEVAVESPGGPQTNIFLKGVDPERVGKVLRIGTRIEPREGVQPLVIGDQLAAKLKVKIGDDVTLVTTNPPPVMYRITGTFHLGLDKYDSETALTTLDGWSALLGGADRVIGIEVAVRDPDAAPAIARELAKTLGDAYTVRDWIERDPESFR